MNPTVSVMSCHNGCRRPQGNDAAIPVSGGAPERPPTIIVVPVCFLPGRFSGEPDVTPPADRHVLGSRQATCIERGEANLLSSSALFFSVLRGEVPEVSVGTHRWRLEKTSDC